MGTLHVLNDNFCDFKARLTPAILAVGLLFNASPVFAVINGEPANEARFGAVGSLKIGNSNEVGCTATLIAPNWIVTADHCIHAMTGSEEEGDGESLPADQYEFRLGSNFKKPVLKVKIKRWVGGPLLNDEALDIAFGELSKPVPIEKLRLSVISTLAQPWNASGLAGSYVHIGYGVQRPFSSEKSALSDKRQMARLKVTAASGNALLKLFGNEGRLNQYLQRYHPEALEAGSVEAILASAEMVAGYSVHAWDQRGRADLNRIQTPEKGWQDTCFGDSGGPLLREIDGQLKVVGVVSQGMDRVCSPLGTRFTVFGPEVQKLMRELGI